jgi:hypothetical protein
MYCSAFTVIRVSRIGIFVEGLIQLWLRSKTLAIETLDSLFIKLFFRFLRLIRIGHITNITRGER